MLCGELHCPKSFELKLFSYKILTAVFEEDLPRETKKVRMLTIGSSNLYLSRGVVGHALPDIRERMTKRLKKRGLV